MKITTILGILLFFATTITVYSQEKAVNEKVNKKGEKIVTAKKSDYMNGKKAVKVKVENGVKKKMVEEGNKEENQNESTVNQPINNNNEKDKTTKEKDKKTKKSDTKSSKSKKE